MPQKQTGFSLMETIIAFAIAMVVFVAVFQFIGVSYTRSSFAADTKMYTFPMYRYGEKKCRMPGGLLESLRIQGQSGLDFVSTSTLITSIHIISPDLLVLTTDSASTSESDIFIIDSHTFEVKGSVDTGPGIRDSIIIGTNIYIANTSVNSHLKILKINTLQSGSAMFSELQSVKISSLTQSGSMPQTLHIYKQMLFIGTEKNSTGAEMFGLMLLPSGLVNYPTLTTEFSGQVHQSAVFKDNLLVSNSADPELHLYNSIVSEVSVYDAPLTLGNGKSVIGVYPYIIFGRTLGSGELSLLKYDRITNRISLGDINKINGTVDFLQWMEGSGNEHMFIAFSANTEKEFQIWKIQLDNLVQISTLNLPGRATSYVCDVNRVIISMNINNKPTLVWLTQ